MKTTLIEKIRTAFIAVFFVSLFSSLVGVGLFVSHSAQPLALSLITYSFFAVVAFTLGTVIVLKTVCLFNFIKSKLSAWGF